MPEPKLKLAQKLCDIMSEIDYLPKDSKNTMQGYPYVSEAAAVSFIRNLLIKNNVIITTKIIEVETRDIVKKDTTKNDWILTTIKTVHTIVDCETGETMEIPFAGQGCDSGDKGIYKASTGANKYFLLRLFLIPTGDDPENEDRKTTKTQSTKTQSSQSDSGKPQKMKDMLMYLANDSVTVANTYFHDYTAFEGEDGKKIRFEGTIEEMFKSKRKWFDNVFKKVKKEYDSVMKAQR